MARKVVASIALLVCYSAHVLAALAAPAARWLADKTDDIGFRIHTWGWK